MLLAAAVVGSIKAKNFWHSLCVFALIWRTGRREGSVTMSRTVMDAVSAILLPKAFAFPMNVPTSDCHG